MYNALIGSLEAGLIFSIMALGVYLTFRILDFPDLTVDGSFTTGGAVAAAMITSGLSPLLSTVTAIVIGCLAGVFTGILHTKGKINALLAGILTAIALYSINLRIMGKANIPLLNQETILSQMNALSQSLFSTESFAILIGIGVLVLLAKLFIDWFLRTEIGLCIRATGNNPRMIRSFSVNTDNMIILGLAISNGFVALGGALWAQYQGFADISMGIGTIIVALASVIIGEVLFGSRSIAVATLAAIGGAIVYRIVVAIALRVGLNPSDMKLMTASIVILALIAPKLIAIIRKKRKKKYRSVISNVNSKMEAK
ncbi:ABC transporter permease [Brevibacillus daliensis]|uniref:ABC transporter permease n=1 Tax=Brevibacillus daliensis TaxID=2892995 RepID=UPI001E2EA010|nr:ABC transporter permease [Brevibacillus daliensis]